MIGEQAKCGTNLFGENLIQGQVEWGTGINGDKFEGGECSSFKILPNI